MAGTNLLTHGFINNGAHQDDVVVDSHFKALIDHLVSNGQNLKGFYQNMGQRGMQL